MAVQANGALALLLVAPNCSILAISSYRFADLDQHTLQIHRGRDLLHGSALVGFADVVGATPKAQGPGVDRHLGDKAVLALLSPHG